MNEPVKTENTDIMDIYQKSDNILTDIQNIIETSQRQAYRAAYGANIIKRLFKELTEHYGKGYDRSNLYHYVRFLKNFSEIVDTACRQSHIRLSWSHYRVLLQVADSNARNWYDGNW